MLSEGTTCSPISLSACAGGGGGYGWISGCVWYNPGRSSSALSKCCGHWMPVEHDFEAVGLLLFEQRVLGRSSAFLHSTIRTCMPSPHETEHWNKELLWKLMYYLVV